MRLAGAETGPADTLRVPSRPVLLAHALVHGLAQHGLAPRSYPPWRGVSDWIDLGLGGDQGDALLAAASAWLGGALSADDAEAAHGLCALLVAGRPEALTGTERPAAVLGRHLLAGPLDPSYRRSLRLDRLLPAAGTGGRRPAGLDDPSNDRAAAPRPGRARTLWAAAGRALIPPPAELAALYGPWRSRWGLVWRRLVRPADLGLRLLTAAASRLRGRWRGPVRL